MDFIKNISYTCISVFMANLGLFITVKIAYLEKLAKPAKNFSPVPLQYLYLRRGSLKTLLRPIMNPAAISRTHHRS